MTSIIKRQSRERMRYICNSNATTATAQAAMSNLSKHCAQRVNYHCYWYGKLTTKHYMSISSCLRTQPNAVVYLWLDSCTNLNHEWYTRHTHRLVVLTIDSDDFSLLTKNTPAEHTYLKWLHQKHNLPLRADCIRYLVLYKYGGVYFDLDVLFLHDISCWTHVEWCYEWIGDNKRRGNNALLNILQESTTATHIIHKICQLQTHMHDCRQVFTRDLPILCLPAAMFDPLWMSTVYNTPVHPRLHTFQDFWKQRKTSTCTFFPTCLAFHWHNRWNVKPKRRSWAAYFLHLYAL